jgi:hypothetical protein
MTAIRMKEMGYSEIVPQPGRVQIAFPRDPRTPRRLNQAQRRAEL